MYHLPSLRLLQSKAVTSALIQSRPLPVILKLQQTSTMALTISGATPWFPHDLTAVEDPSIVSRNSRSSGFFSGGRRLAKDADHYDMVASGTAASTETPELQDDSFVNFSVGNLDRRNFSVLGVVKYMRPSSTSRSGLDSCGDDSTLNENDRGIGLWRRRKKRDGGRVKRGDSFLSPVRRCFY